MNPSEVPRAPIMTARTLSSSSSFTLAISLLRPCEWRSFIHPMARELYQRTKPKQPAIKMKKQIRKVIVSVLLVLPSLCKLLMALSSTTETLPLLLWICDWFCLILSLISWMLIAIAIHVWRRPQCFNYLGVISPHRLVIVMGVKCWLKNRL